MDYPVKSPTDWLRMERLSLRSAFFLAVRELRYRFRAVGKERVELKQISIATADASDGVTCICVVKDAEKYIPSFLEHYRRLGVERFAIIDDQSGDSTVDLLRNAPDVDLYTSNVGYVESRRGALWRDLLFDIYGRDRWYIAVDVDEYLIYPGCEDTPVEAFVSQLESGGHKRALAIMLDIYPDGPLKDAPEHTPIDASPLTVSPLFDAGGYTLSNERICAAIRGGPRYRLFESDGRLTKFPLLFADRRTQFAGASVHGPLPLLRNFSPVHAALLHYKFGRETVEEFQGFVHRGTHAGGAIKYRAIVEHDLFDEYLDLRCEFSRRYDGSESLVELGFIRDLR